MRSWLLLFVATACSANASRHVTQDAQSAPAARVAPPAQPVPTTPVQPVAAPATATTLCQVPSAEMLFLPAAGGRVNVSIRGGGLYARALPPRGRIGNQELQRMTISQDGGAVAQIDTMPKPGDRLFLGYWDEELCDTGLVYRP